MREHLGTIVSLVLTAVVAVAVLWWMPDLLSFARGRPPAAAPAPTAAPATPAAGPSAAPDRGDVSLTVTPRQFAGGRPLRWWAEHLRTLRRDGPAPLYALALGRARVVGLAVVEGDGGEVSVSVAEQAARP